MSTCNLHNSNRSIEPVSKARHHTTGTVQAFGAICSLYDDVERNTRDKANFNGSRKNADLGLQFKVDLNLPTKVDSAQRKAKKRNWDADALLESVWFDQVERPLDAKIRLFVFGMNSGGLMYY